MTRCNTCGSEAKTFTGCCLYAAAKDYKGWHFSELSDSELTTRHTALWVGNDPDRHILQHEASRRGLEPIR